MKKITITCTSEESGAEIHKMLCDIFYDGKYFEYLEDADWCIEGV